MPSVSLSFYMNTQEYGNYIKKEDEIKKSLRDFLKEILK